MSRDAEELLRVERLRCDAISTGDLEALGRLLADDLTHTHITGRTEDKATYLHGLSGRARTTTRSQDLRVRIYGDVAVMTGTLRNAFPAVDPSAEPRVLEIHATQVWVRADSDWKQVAFASSGQVPGT